MSEPEPRRDATLRHAVAAAGRFADRYFAPRDPDPHAETGPAPPQPAESRRTRRPPFRQHLARGWLRRSGPR
jgi:hypothetical protein